MQYPPCHKMVAMYHCVYMYEYPVMGYWLTLSTLEHLNGPNNHTAWLWVLNEKQNEINNNAESNGMTRQNLRIGTLRSN